jgi:endo-1,4-beta-mannosidase
MGEHIDEYGNPNSKTIEYVRRYTEEVVQRYKDSPAIWGWEFGNEYSLDCDLPNAAEHRPPVWPDLGTAKVRTERDELRFVHLRVAYVEFAKAVRKSDRSRPIFTGNSVPRRAAWHNVKEKKWTADSEAQFAEILMRDNPDPVNTISVHLYPESKGDYSGGAKTIAEAVAVANKHALASGKPLCIGEFGAPRQLGARAEQESAFQQFLDAIVKERVPLAMFWVFDLAGQDKDWNVSFQNDRAWMIERVTRANAQLRNLPRQ